MSALISFALLALLARWMGPARFGEYVWLLSVSVLLLVAVEGGWPALIYRESSTREPDATPPHAGRATRHVLLVTVVVAPLAAALIAPALGLGVLCMAGVALANLVSARLRGAGRFGADALWQLAVRSGTALAIVAAVHLLGATPAAVFAAWAAAMGILLFGVAKPWITSPTHRPPGAAWHASGWIVLLEAGLIVMQRGDMALLGWTRLPPQQLADYAVGTRVTELAVLGLAPMNNVLLRSLRRAWPDDRAFCRLLVPALGAAFALGFAAFVASLWAGTALLVLAFGPDYRSAGALLPWILAGLPFLLANLVLAQAALAQGREECAARRWLGVGVISLLAVGLSAQWGSPQFAAASMAIGQAALLVASLLPLRSAAGSRP